MKTINDFVNLPAGNDVYPRLLPNVNVGTLSGIREAIFEAGGLPAKPFVSKPIMVASNLPDGSYAQVTDSPIDNGLYLKVAGVWVKSSYDPITSSKIDFEYNSDANLLHKFTHKVEGNAVNYNGSVVSNANHSAAVIDVVAGTKLFIANSTNTTNGGSGSESKFYAANPFTSTQSSISDNRKLVQIAGVNYVEVTVPVGATKLVVNTRYNSLDIAWAIYKNTPSSNFGYGSYKIKSLDGVDVLPKKSRLDSQKVAIFGDELSSSAYVAALTKSTGAVITSYAEAGTTSATLADIVAAGLVGYVKRDAASSQVSRSAINYLDIEAVVIMIGSNDAPIVSNGDTSVLPKTNAYNSGIPVPAYLNKFPDTYLGNLALAIEYIKYKSPTVEITIVSPPYINQAGVDENAINSLYPAIASLAKFYSVNFADATHNSGLSYKLMATGAGYSTDGKLLTSVGNQLLSKFVALKVTN